MAGRMSLLPASPVLETRLCPRDSLGWRLSEASWAIPSGNWCEHQPLGSLEEAHHSNEKKNRHFFGLFPATICSMPRFDQILGFFILLLQLSVTVLNWGGRRKLLLMGCRLQTPSPIQLPHMQETAQVRICAWGNGGHEAEFQNWGTTCTPIHEKWEPGASFAACVFCPHRLWLFLLKTLACTWHFCSVQYWGNCLVYCIFSTWFTGTKDNSHLHELEMFGWLSSFDKPGKKMNLQTIWHSELPSMNWKTRIKKETQMFCRKIDKECMQTISKEEIQTSMKHKKCLCTSDYI